MLASKVRGGYTKTAMCRGCWEVFHLPIFIRSPLAVPFRLAGIETSGMHPNTCTLCEKRFKGLMKAPQISLPLTILFADLRNYTSLSNTTDPREMNELLGHFYQACGEVIWAREGLINKVIGDAVLAVFNFPFRREQHVSKAVEAAVELQRRCKASAINVGIGIHTGETMFGEVGEYLRDFTVIGPVVNLAARLQTAAAPGEVVVTEAVFQEAGGLLPGARERSLELKGVTGPVRAYAFSLPDEEGQPAATGVTVP